MVQLFKALLSTRPSFVNVHRLSVAWYTPPLPVSMHRLSVPPDKPPLPCPSDQKLLVKAQPFNVQLTVPPELPVKLQLFKVLSDAAPPVFSTRMQSFKVEDLAQP